MEPLVHLIVPVLIVLAFKPRLDKRLVLGLSVLTVLPDLDVIVGHRSLFHNIFFVIISSLFVLLLFFLAKSSKRMTANAGYLSLFYLSSHLLFDIGRPGIPFFYPISDRLYGVSIRVLASSAGGIANGLSLHLDPAFVINDLSLGTTMVNSPAINTFGVMLLLVVIILGLSSWRRKEW